MTLSIKANEISCTDKNTFPLSQKQRSDDLIQEAKEAKYFLDNFLDNFETEFSNPQNLFFYVISSRWLREWKKYTSYDNVTNDIPLDEEYFGQIYPSKINQDILTDYYATKYPGDDDYRNVVLREGLEEKRDYEIVTETAWKFFAQKYDHVTIKRPAHILSDGKKIVEVELMQIHIVSATKQLFRAIDIKRVYKFPVYSLQASAYTTIKDFKSDMIEILNSQLNTHLIPDQRYLPVYSNDYEVSEDMLHLWLLDPALDLNSFFIKIKTICNTFSHYDYQMEFQGIYLEKDSSSGLGEIFAPNESTIFLDSRLPDKGWIFFGDGVKALQKCEYCSNFRDLLFVCDCKKVSYCSKECLVKHKKYHKNCQIQPS